MKTTSALILLAMLSSRLPGQSVNSNLEGWVTDAKGEPILNANVIVTSPTMLGIRGASTNADGYFHVLAVPTGVYFVKISHAAYVPGNVKDIRVPLGGTARIGKVKLDEKTVALGEVVVTSERPAIDPQSTTNGRNLRDKELQPLPLQRDHRQIANLLPQATVNYLQDGLSIEGSTGLENKYFIQGIDVTDALLGAVPLQKSIRATNAS